MHDIDDIIADDEAESSRGKSKASDSDDIDLYPRAKAKVEVGTVERFFDRVSVAAIRLTGDLKVGDTVEMDGEDGPITVEVSSMQIDRKDIEAATAGDSVGIKVEAPVKRGSRVYLVGSVD
jgi:translation elongation factor EF-Tu-like GTPase